MKVSELRQKVKDAGGKLKMQYLDMECVGTADVDIHSKEGDLIMWIGAATKDEENVEDGITVANTAVKNINAVVEFVQLIGLTIGDIKPTEIEKVIKTEVEVVRPDPETERKLAQSEGMVQAYEKILLGRDVTVGK